MDKVVESRQPEEPFSASGRAERFFCDDCPDGLEIVGRSEGIRRALGLLATISLSRCNPILILGETGTGKELAARAVHSWRHGESCRFVAVNCASLTANLLESELFGHVKGAFTGADRDKTGLFELARDGSIFLDEISEMAPDLQAKLLRVLQERAFRRVGGTTDIPCNATVIASSNRDLLQEVHHGRFRKDLYYRLAVFPVTMPPLRAPDRRGDIPLLAEHFLLKYDHPANPVNPVLSEPAVHRLMSHDWPGNVRELRNVIERALILDRSAVIEVNSLVFDHQPTPSAVIAPRVAAGEFSLEAAEREFILRALKEANWQRTKAAGLLGITRATLHAKLKRYEIKAPGGKSPSQVES
jgi:transcriptional regulator with PAS, ATPase and Fis domain